MRSCVLGSRDLNSLLLILIAYWTFKEKKLLYFIVNIFKTVNVAMPGISMKAWWVYSIETDRQAGRQVGNTITASVSRWQLEYSRVLSK